MAAGNGGERDNERGGMGDSIFLIILKILRKTRKNRLKNILNTFLFCKIGKRKTYGSFGCLRK